MRRRIGEDLLPECIQQTVKFGGGSVMVWGCISRDGIGPITKVEGRMNGKDYIRLLSRHLLPYMPSISGSIRWIFKCFQTFGRYCINIVCMSFLPFDP